jgi:ketosteroid isomerase-like protein
MTEKQPVPDDLLDALRRIADALDDMGHGDPAPYAELWPESADVTLFEAWGPTERGHDDVTRTFGSRFSGGPIEPRYEVIHADGDLACTIGYEVGTVRVDGGPETRMRLRVTHVLRRVDGQWRLVHRHADVPPEDPRAA